jgi:hypothetical protein
LRSSGQGDPYYWEFLTGGIAREAEQPAAIGDENIIKVATWVLSLNRCNSGADGTVRMEEDPAVKNYSLFCPEDCFRVFSFRNHHRRGFGRYLLHE